MPTDWSLREQEEHLRDVLFGRNDPELAAAVTNGPQALPLALLPPEAMSIYRRLVRGNFRAAIRKSLPICDRLLGQETLDSLIDSFLQDRPGQIRALWQVPAAFAAWIAAHPPVGLPPALAELIHFECVELEILYAADGVPVPSPRPPQLAARIEADPSARLLAYRFPVHQMSQDTRDFPDMSPQPHFLLAWRVKEKMQSQEITALLAKVLMYCGSQSPISFGVEQLRNEGAVDLDPDAILRAFGGLQSKGALVDFPPGE